MYSSTSLVDRYPSTVQNPYLGLTLFTAVSFITHMVWPFFSHLTDLGGGGSVLFSIGRQSPYWLTGLYSLAILVWTASFSYEDFFSYSQERYSVMRTRTSPCYARERRFCLQVICIANMAGIAVHRDILALWYLWNSYYWTMIEPMHQAKEIELVDVACFLGVLAMNVCACASMVAVWFPSMRPLQYMYEAHKSEQYGESTPTWEEKLQTECADLGSLVNIEDLAWDEKLLVNSITSESTKVLILGRKALIVQNALAAKDRVIDGYKAKAKKWKDMLEEAHKAQGNCETGSEQQVRTIIRFLADLLEA